MFETFWTRWLAIALAVGASWALRSVGAHRVGNRKRLIRAKAVAAARLSLLLLAGWLILSQIVTSSRGLPIVLQWPAGIVGAVFALLWFANVLAGLWLVSPFVTASPGDNVVACGQPGRLVGYGIARLQLETETGWTAHLLYLAVAFHPLLVSPRGSAPVTELTFTKADWTSGELSCLRETAILAPFRDLSMPVTISRHDDVVRVRLALARPEAQEAMRRCLESALTAPRSEDDRVEQGAAAHS